MTLASRWIKSPQIWALFFPVLFLGQVLLNLHLWKAERLSVEVSSEKAFKSDPTLSKVLSFGHIGVVIDWIWLNCLLDTSPSKVPAGTHPQLYFDLDLLTDLDPAFSEAYVVGANLLAIVRNDVRGARDLLLKGDQFRRKDLEEFGEKFREQFWGSAWNISLLLAYVYLFELNDMPHAADAFRQAAASPNAPDYVVRLDKRLQRPGGEYEVGLRLLNFMINTTADHSARAELEKKKLSLFIGQYLFEINHGFQTYLSAQSGYRALRFLTPQQMNIYWKEFKKESQIPDRDPWGGRIYMNPSGKVASTTPYSSVFGLE
jgi:hypothetical protein